MDSTDFLKLNTEYIFIVNLQKLFSNLSSDITGNNKELLNLFDVLEHDFKNLKLPRLRSKQFNVMNINEDINYINDINLEFIDNIRDAIKSQKSKFNIFKYLSSKKHKNIELCKKQGLKIDHKVATNTKKSSTKHTNKRHKKESVVSKSYDDDDEFDDEDDDDDDDDDYDPYEDDEEYNPFDDVSGGGGDGDDFDDDSNSRKRKKPSSKTMKPDIGIIGSSYIAQLYRGKDSGRLEDDTIYYYQKLQEKEQNETYDKLKAINEYQQTDVPILFKIANLDLPLNQRNHIMKNYIIASTSRGEQKLKQWTDNILQIPFGVYKGTNLNSIKPKRVKKFINKLQEQMDKAAFGHEEAKRLIVQIMGQQIRNPTGKASILAIHGCMGNGKTTIIKDGIAAAMDKPFVFISLGGATDASFLEGHSYTYEGSIYGRIVNGLIESKCMDPIFYFDELDKISKTHKGDEITNLLVHLTDPVQNSHFRDKYFHGIDIDLSRATMIFSFNDPSNVNPILLDRITTVETKHLLPTQKVHIAQNYLCPAMFKEMGLEKDAIIFTDEIIRDLIDKYTCEGGVRKLKSHLYSIARELNLSNLTNEKIDGDSISFPFTVKSSHIKHLLKHKMEIDPEKIHTEPKCGVINGLYATSSGSYGGVLPIEILWTPTSSPLEFKTTGNLEKVIKESTQVASTLAFNRLDPELRNKLLKDLKESPQGFHIHMADGSTSKDGPSAGTALTVALYSMLTNKKIRNDVAITGEITLQGNVTAIGGLDNKLEGAKKAGVKLVLCPKENEKHLIKIKERDPTLIDESFKVITIETIDEALKYSLIE